ncbi:2-aminomuconate deaminase [Roseibium album]|nr:2-aminomuconate deaminase [Roseibium album]
MTVYRHKPGARMSHAVRVGDIVFLAGQIPQDLTGDIAAQTREVLDGIDRVMKELGGDKSNVVSVQVWLSDMSDFQGMNSVWDEWVDKENPPARATGGVALARPGMRVEMIATGHL